jgi:hypothetical protein
MSTIIIALIIVTFIVLICILLISIHNKHRKKLANELIAQFQCEGAKNDLLLSKWEMAGKLVIGLEADKKILYAFQKHLDQYRSYLVDLSKVKNCLKKKVYSNKISGNGKNERYEREVEHISLQFEFVDERPPVTIAFYDPVNNHLLEMAEMEQKAADWEDVVRGIIHPN